MTNSLRALFSRKERARRKHQQAAQQSIPQIPPVYKASFYDSPPPDAVPRSAHPRPLSSFAPDYSRQSQYAYAPQQLPRASLDQPPRYPALPTYDPSKYQTQPIRPTSIYGADVLSSYAYQNQTHSLPQSRIQNQSSRLSAVHYTDARSSIYQPPPPPAPRENINMPYHARRQSAMPFPPSSSVASRSSRPGEGRERSVSEPGHVAAQSGRGGPRRAKPVLSRLITNFG